MSVATVKLFHADPYQSEFNAHVVSCVPSGTGWDVVLDQTLFYADSGGQPSDSGSLAQRRVLAVREDEAGVIVHTVDGPLDGEISGAVDRVRRLDHMWQHTGQHLLSGVFAHLLNAETVSWHLGTESCTIDLAIEALSMEQVEQIELECNRVIRACLPVVTHLVDETGLAALPVRKPPAVTDNIRVVEILGYDWSACAGTHVRNTGELGLLKVKAWERNKRFTRVEFLVGNRAVGDYIALDRLTRDLCRSLSIAVLELPRYVERSQEEGSALRKQVKFLQERILEAEALELIANGRKVAGATIVRLVLGGRPLEDVKLLAAKVASHNGTVAVFGTKGAIPQVILYRSVDLRIDVGGILQQVLPLIDGRGGGSPVQAQGGGSRPEALEAALDQAIQKVSEALHQ